MAMAEAERVEGDATQLLLQVVAAKTRVKVLPSMSGRK